MSTTTNSHIQQILKTFDDFIRIYENDEWLKSADNIKNCFKLGSFIEKTINNFQTKNSTIEFINTLNTWWKQTKQRTLFYDVNFYRTICDNLLIKFFETKNLNTNTLDIAIRIYASIFPKERLENVLNNLLKTSASFEAILEFLCANQNDINTNDLKCELILNEWTLQLETNGNVNGLKSTINSLLTSNKVENNLATLFGILLLELSDNNSVESQVKSLIIENILEKMLDRSILTKNFWLTLFKKIDKILVTQLSEQSQDFYTSFCNFLLYVGGIMEKNESENEIKWISVESISLIPEINYIDLLGFVKCFYENSSLRPYIVSRLMEAQNYADCTVWEQIMLDCT